MNGDEIISSEQNGTSYIPYIARLSIYNGIISRLGLLLFRYDDYDPLVIFFPAFRKVLAENIVFE